MAQGPLSGVKVVEFAGIGPGPFCGMLLSDLGADVVRIDRKGGRGGAKSDITSRGRRSVALDLKQPAAVEACLKLMDGADAILEGFDRLERGHPRGESHRQRHDDEGDERVQLEPRDEQDQRDDCCHSE